MPNVTFYYKSGEEVKDLSKVKVPIDIQISLIEGITGRRVAYEKGNNRQLAKSK